MRENRNVLVGLKTTEMLDADGRVPPTHIEVKPSGAFVDPFDLDPDLVFIEDVASSLARIARFTGYSDSYGAEHALIVESILCANDASALVRLHGLLHDAHEAYLGDVPRPLKYRPQFAFYREACDRAQVVIYRALDLPLPTEDAAAAVKRADELSLLVEARRGLPSRGECWRMATQELVEEADDFAMRFRPMGMDHEELEEKFLWEYRNLRREAGV